MALTRNGELIGVYIWISKWRATQEALNLLRDHPKELLESLVLHQRLQETGKPEGITLKEFRSSLEKSN